MNYNHTVIESIMHKVRSQKKDVTIYIEVGQNDVNSWDIGNIIKMFYHHFPLLQFLTFFE